MLRLTNIQTTIIIMTNIVQLMRLKKTPSKKAKVTTNLKRNQMIKMRRHLYLGRVIEDVIFVVLKSIWRKTAIYLVKTPRRSFLITYPNQMSPKKLRRLNLFAKRYTRPQISDQYVLIL